MDSGVALPESRRGVQMDVEAELKKLLMDAPRTVIAPMQTIVIRASMRAYSTIEAPLWSRPNSLAILTIRFKGCLPQ